MFSYIYGTVEYVPMYENVQDTSTVLRKKVTELRMRPDDGRVQEDHHQRVRK